MSPSSLIFVAVVASWVIYFVVHVARRREQLATARNVDRFSNQMRVLQRRAVASADVEPSVRLKSASSGIGRPLVAGASMRTAPVGGRTVVEAIHVDSESDRQSAAHVRAREIRRNQVRAVFLLGSLVAFLVTVPMAILGMVSGLIPVSAFGVAVLTFVRMRAAVLARHSARTRAAAARSREYERNVRYRAEAAHEVRPAARTMPVAQEFVDVRDHRTCDTPAAQAATSVPSQLAVDPLFADGGWEPKPVPPPTYTMKAKARRPAAPKPVALPAPVEFDYGDAYYDDGEGQSRVLGA